MTFYPNTTVATARRLKRATLVVAATACFCATRCDSFAFSPRRVPSSSAGVGGLRQFLVPQRPNAAPSRMRLRHSSQPDINAPGASRRGGGRFVLATHRYRDGRPVRSRAKFSDKDFVVDVDDAKRTFSPIDAVGADDDTSPIEFRNDKKESLFGSHPQLPSEVIALREKMKAFLLAAALALTFFLGPQSAFAVTSGGRMGGSVGGCSSRSSYGRSYSAPRSRSFSPRSSSSYSRGYNRGLSNGYYNNVVVSPGISPFSRPWYNPLWAPSNYASPSGLVVSTGPPFGGFLFCTGFLLLSAVALKSVGSDVSNSIGRSSGGSGLLGPGVSVAEISVALEVPDRDSPNSILSALKRLSDTARTDSRVGLQNLTSQVALELLRRQNSIVAASTKSSHYLDESEAQREFNSLSFQERGKFSRETVSKYGGVDYSDARNELAPTEYSSTATVAVITIIALIDGDSTKLPTVQSIGDVKEALSTIAADSKVDDCLRGVEILWTPEERDESLTMREVFADYSSLRSV